MKSYGKYVIPLIILSTFTLYFAYDFFTLKKHFWHPDISTYYYPLRQWYVSRLLNGEFPVWNPYWGLGQPSDAWASIPIDIYTPLEIYFGAQYHYFIALQLWMILLTAFYVLTRLGFDPFISSAGAILFFLAPWVTYFYFYFLIASSYISNLLLFLFVYQWFRSENYKYLFYVVAAFILGMLGTKVEFWFYNAAMYVFYVFATAAVLCKNRFSHSAKLALIALIPLATGMLAQTWQFNFLTRIFEYSNRGAVTHSFLNLFSMEMYRNVFMSILESAFFRIMALGTLVYLCTTAKRYLIILYLVTVGMIIIQFPLLFSFIKSPVFIGAIIGLWLSLSIPKSKDWRSQVLTGCLFLLFVYYWCRPYKDNLAEAEVIRTAPAMFKILLAALFWLGCNNLLSNKVGWLAYLAMIYVFIMRDQGQIVMSYLTGLLWIPTRDNYLIDWGVAIISVLGLAQLQFAEKLKQWVPIKYPNSPAYITLGIAILASCLNPYYMHGAVQNTVPGYPYYNGIKPVREVIRELKDSPTWRAFFYDDIRYRGYTWGFESILMESASQVTMYSTIASKNYVDWSLYRQIGIKPMGVWGTYTAEYSEKTLNRLPKMNTNGLTYETIFNYVVYPKPPLEKSALQLLGVNHVIMANSLSLDGKKQLKPKSIKRIGPTFMGQLYYPTPKEFEGLLVAEIDDPLPRAFLAYGVTPENLEEFQHELKPEIKERTIITTSATFPYEPAQIDIYEPEYVSLNIETKKQADLVLLDLDHPFWHVRLDGKEIKINTAFHLFRSTIIPPGKHLVEFYCEIPYFKASVITSAIFIILPLLGYFYMFFRGRFSMKKPDPSPTT